MPAPVLIPLVYGLIGGGVITCALGIANRLAAQGRRVGLILHSADDRYRQLSFPLDASIRITDLRGHPPLASAQVDLDTLADAYAQAVRELGDDADAAVNPCAVLASQHAECYGLCARLTQLVPGGVRIVGWRHIASAYDRFINERYEPCLSEIVAVGPSLAEDLKRAMPTRAGDISAIPNAVEVRALRRAALYTTHGARPLRIVFVGRLENDQKRVLSLIAMSTHLERAGIAHQLELIGDGPLEQQLRQSQSAYVRLAGVLPPEQVRERLEAADIFVLASWVEGMSMSLLEAMERGCVPVVARTAGDGVILDAGNGIVCDLTSSDDDAAGASLAEGVCRGVEIGLQRLSDEARLTVERDHDVEKQAMSYARLIDRAAARPTRVWPSDRAWKFRDLPPGAGTVPADAVARMTALLDELASRSARVGIHGTGAHTTAVRESIVSYRSSVIAICDETAGVAPSPIPGVDVIPPSNAAKAGITDIVISSWLNQDAIWTRRRVYERQGIRVHRLYPSACSTAVGS